VIHDAVIHDAVIHDAVIHDAVIHVTQKILVHLVSPKQRTHLRHLLVCCLTYPKQSYLLASTGLTRPKGAIAPALQQPCGGFPGGAAAPYHCTRLPRAAALLAALLSAVILWLSNGPSIFQKCSPVCRPGPWASWISQRYCSSVVRRRPSRQLLKSEPRVHVSHQNT
jgi:hypothetical protein